MFKLIRFLKNYKIQSVIGPFFKLLEACFELFVPLVMASIIDVGIKNSDSGYIWQMGGVLVILGIVGLCCSLIAQYFAAKASVGFGTELRHALFKHINSLSYSEIGEIGTSTLITRMTNDINLTQNGVNWALRLFMRAPFIVIGALIMAFTVSTKGAFVFVVAVPLMAAVIFTVMFISIPLYKKIQGHLDRINMLSSENLAGVRVIRAFCRQRKETEEFADENEKLMRMQILVGKISALLNPVTYIIVNAAVIAIIWIGGSEVFIGGITQGELIALTNYMLQILHALLAMMTLIISFTKAFASADRINEIFDCKSSMDESGTLQVTPQGTAVEFENVSFSYKTSSENALSNITFNADRGEVIGIIGGTGSGKSTLVNLIARFYDATSGTIRLFGNNIKEYDTTSLRQTIGIVPQKAVLFNGTIRDNMKMGYENAADDEILSAIKIAQAQEIVDGKEDSLDEIILQGGKNLSGGQKQRLTIARALVGKPQILILDDSASALDFATDAKLRKTISEELSDTLVFIVSQRTNSIINADRIIVLDDGEVVGIGSHKELMENCELYREICKSQLSEEEAGA